MYKILCVHIFLSFEYMLRNEIAGLYSNSMFNILRDGWTFPWVISVPIVFSLHTLRNTDLGNDLGRMEEEKRYLLDSDHENPRLHKMEAKIRKEENAALENNETLCIDVNLISGTGKLEIQRKKLGRNDKSKLKKIFIWIERVSKIK